MSERHMTEGEYALRLAASIADAEDNNRMVWSSTAGTVALARALLSTSSAVRGMRELVDAATNYVRCARPYSNLSPYISENGRHGGSPWSELCDAVAALSLEGEDEQATRSQGLATAPTDRL